MGTYYIPRNLGGETRILYIFTVKSLLTTGVGALIGSIFFLLIGLMLGEKTIGLIILAIFALLGWIYGAVKIPTVGGIAITKSVGGESLNEIINRYIKFKMNKKVYTSTKEEK